MKKKLFIVFDGPEGGGKSTQIDFLEEYLEGKGLNVLVTKEPGGTDAVCADIRKVLLDKEHKDKFSARAELLLFCGDRAQHVDFVIKPALAPESKYDAVLCDRYEGVMYAYQYFARGACNLKEFGMLNNYATEGLKPDFTFILDVDFETGGNRNKKAEKKDRFELEAADFHNKGRKGFGEYCEKELFPGTWAIIDGAPSERVVFENIKKKIDTLLERQEWG